MKMRIAILGLSCLFTLPLAAEETPAAPAAKASPVLTLAKPHLKSYRQSLKKYGKNLKKTLKQAMKKGGPVNAMSVCNSQALPITKQHSDMHAWEISRTSLKPRNPANAPDAWETKIMQDFDKRRAAGEKPKTLEYSEIVVAEDGSKSLRYIKAIPTGKVCLQCHGSDLKPEVSAKLTELYPDDKATGFKVGDLRGAFSITEAIK